MVRVLQGYVGKFEILVGLLSLGLASVIFNLCTRKRASFAGLTATGRATAGLAAGALVLLTSRKDSE